MNPKSCVARALAAGMLAASSLALADEAKPDPTLVARGGYLAKAADCLPCHTAAPDKPFAGG